MLGIMNIIMLTRSVPDVRGKLKCVVPRGLQRYKSIPQSVKTKGFCTSRDKADGSSHHAALPANISHICADARKSLLLSDKKGKKKRL